MELGVMVSIREGTDFPTAFAEARAAGFSRGQVTCQINGITADEVRRIALAAKDAHFHVDAVGCYLNPLRLDDAVLDSVDITDWNTLVANMGMMNGCERIVCWSGTLGKNMAVPNLLNQEEATFNSLFIALSGLLDSARGLPLQIILEPYTAHVLHDVVTCARMARKFPSGQVKIVLDAPNLIAHKEFARRDERAQEMVRGIAPVVGLVHLKDIAYGPTDHRVFPPAGQGALDFPEYLRVIAEHVPAVPAIIERCKSVEEMRATREYVELALKRLNL